MSVLYEKKGAEFAERLWEIFQQLSAARPLIHSITSPIAINDCANAILAVGAQPICAEHPREVADITRMAKALTVSLANITDARMESILISGKASAEAKIPSVIDAVGVTCSPMRVELAETYLIKCDPAVVKGNVSEIRALAGASYESSGIDVGEKDAADMDHESQLLATAELIRKYAKAMHTVILASGAVDILSDGEKVYLIENGCAAMSRVTGTGCILTCIIGAFLAVADPLTAAVCAVSLWGLCGEISEKCSLAKGLGSFHVGLLDALSKAASEDVDVLKNRMKVLQI